MAKTKTKTKTSAAFIRPVRSAKDLREQIQSGIDLRDWEPEHIARIFEEHISLQEMLRRAQSALEEDGRMRGESPIMDDIAKLLGD